MIKATEISAALFDRHLCAECYKAWADWQNTSFRIFLGETLAFHLADPGPPPPLG